MPGRRSKQSLASNERRHDTGLIAPGKKVIRKKSQPQIAANVNGRPQNPSPDVLSHDGRAHTTATELVSGNDAYDYNDADPAESSSRSDSDGYVRAGSSFEHGKGATDKIGSIASNGGPHIAIGTLISHERLSASSSSASSALTIISPHYRWDVLAILLLLLQLPPLFQIVVQVVFAYMTFGNPTSSWAPGSFAPMSDWARSHGGNPSIVVSVVADVGFLVFWLIMPYIKDFILDLAPAVIAISLGGGPAGGTSWSHAGLCTGAVLADHIFKDQRRRQYISNLVVACLSRMSLSSRVPEPFTLPLSTQASRNWGRIALELHIVTHGCVKVVRRWYESSARQSNRRDPARADNDTGSPVNGSSSNVSNESTAEGFRNGSTDGRPPGPSPAGRDRTVSSGKKRRKQATFVRTQQPFWAAIAQARIHLSKEIEQSHSKRDQFEAGSKNELHLGDASFNCLEDRAWITKLEDTEVWFKATLVKTEENDGDEREESLGTKDRRGSLGSKFVDVRVNGAFWSSVDCTDWPPTESDPDKVKVECKIFGLTPFASYVIEIVRRSDHSIIYSGNLFTRPANSPDQATTLSTAPAASSSSLRPSSPTTTLIKSIATVESRLVERKNRSAKVRKSHQTTIRNFNKDVADLTKSLQSSGTDERQRQRQIQYRQNIKQAEDAIVDLEQKLANLGEIPKTDQENFEASQARYNTAKERHDEARSALDAKEREFDKLINDVKAENAKIRTKCEKSEIRLASLNERKKVLSEENSARKKARATSEVQHASRIEYHQNQERELIAKLQQCNQQRLDLETRMAEMRQYIYNGYQYNNQHHNSSSLTHTPESSYATMSTNRSLPGVTFQNPIGTPAFHSRQNSSRNRTRPRSTSMLSDVSDHAPSEMISNQFSPDGGQPQRNTSAGNGIGGPWDPKNPSPPKLSPIGSEVGRGSPRSVRR